MKILDKYIVKNFLTGYIIAFCVLIGLRIVIELFVNLDEFTENADLGTLVVLKNILVFYSLRITLYFRDFAGVIIVIAAAFSIGKMVRSGELIAVTASGVSLKRVMEPIIILAIVLTGLLVIDQEFIIPPLSDQLVRDEGIIPGQESYRVNFILDNNGSLFFSQKFDVKTATLHKPNIIIRQQSSNPAIWDVTAWIFADKAVYNNKTDKWELINGYMLKSGSEKIQPIDSYSSDIKPEDIPVRHKSKFKTLLSSRQLASLARAAQRTNIKDLPQLYSQKHFRITDPVMNFVMLMISLPILVCRDPKTMKSSIAISFGLTVACFITNFICKLLATEVIFDTVRPELWAWIPVFIFLPIAFIELDAMKT